MPKFKTAIMQAEGMDATGIVVPDAVVEKLASGKRPKVAVTLNGYTYRSTVAVMGGQFMLPLAVWPPLAGFTSWVFAVPALLLGAWLIHLSLRFLKNPERLRARRLFFATLLYLPAMLAALLLCARR